LDGSKGIGRPALAASVGLVCVLACAAVVTLLAGGRSDGSPVNRSAAKPPRVGTPHAHADLRAGGMSERELRATETATLGAEHAREHALTRRALRLKTAGGEADDPLARPAAAAAAAAIPPPGDPAEVGQWETAKVPFPITAIHAAMLPTGKVMFFTYPKDTNYAQAWLWDPANDPTGAALVRKDPPDLNGLPANIWCAGQTFTASGELVVFGGNLEFPLPNAPGTTWKGLDRVYTFDSISETWTEQPPMRHGRWYPTGIRMADGRIPIISGLDEGGIAPGQTNPEVEVFTPSPSPGGQGTMAYVGNVGGTGRPPFGGLYPHMFAMPDGRTLIAGPAREDSWFLDNVNQNPFLWSNVDDLDQPHSWGTSVLMPGGVGGSTKVMALGGSDWTETPSSPATELIDVGTPGATWKPAKSNVIGRGHANTVLLPDGSMVEVGGGRGKLDSFPSPLHAASPEQRQIELWDPVSEEWQLGPAQTEARAYHSTALLLPDGRVMSAGDEYNGDGVNVDTAEIYKPPYLFQGARPEIGAAPPEIEVGTAFGVSTPDTNIRSAALVAPAAVTHGVDMNQRVIGLGVTRRSGCVSITAPPANVAPPGPYMLFLLDDKGVPSIAKFVKLQSDAPSAPCTGAPLPTDTTPPIPSITTPAAGATVSGTVTVKANAQDNDVVVGVQFKRDGVNLGPEDTRPPFSAPWESAKSTNGDHTLTAVARDATGNLGEASLPVKSANLDTTPPAVSLTSPRSGGPPLSGPVDLAVLAGDDGGLDEIQFMVDDQKIGEAVPAEPNVNVYTKAWNTTDVTDGNHVLRAVATDKAGLETTSLPVSVTVDNPEPPPTDSVPPVPKPTPPVTTPPAGNPPPSQPPAPANAAPAISRLKLSPAKFRRGAGTTIGFRLSEAARVTVSFERKLPGRRVRGRCVKPAEGRRSNCTRYVALKTKLRLQGRAGPNVVALRARAFAIGSYRLTVLATDPAGKRSAPARESFRLLASPPKRAVKIVRAALLSWL
jgi:hypothetical protein